MSSNKAAVLSAIIQTFPKRTCYLLLLSGILFVSALGLVYVKDHYRHRFIQLEKIKNKQEALETSWSQLLLEQSTFAAHARIVRMAKENLHMHQPKAVQIRMLPSTETPVTPSN